MSQFEKFPSIQEDWVSRNFRYAEFHSAPMAVTEKIDGANLQFYFQNGQQWRVGKRSGFVHPGDTFFNLWDVLESHQQAIESLDRYAAEEKVSLRVFGELFGAEVVKRIDYRVPGDLRFFQVDRNGERLPYAAMLELMTKLQLDSLLAPLLGEMTIEKALQLSPKFPSRLNSEAEAEGFVISGWENTFPSKNGSPFLLKVKNPNFRDLEGSDASNPTYLPVLRYLNANRIFSVESKHGAFHDFKQMGKYVELVMAEVNEDFQKDHGTEPDPPVTKFKGEIGKLIVDHIKAQQ